MLANLIEKKLIVAHRGYSYIYPENTLIAFEKSLEKADLIEFDVQFTKDNIAVILHDDTLVRTSNILEFEEFDFSIKLEDFTYEQLLKLDFGSWKNYNNQKILTLTQFVSFAKKREVFFNLEIKDLKDTKFDKTCCKDILNQIKELKNQVIISSFNKEYIKSLREMDKDICLALLIENKEEIKFIDDLNINGCHISDEMINQNLIKELNKKNIYTGVYTINDKKRKKELFAMGVNIIFTDKLE